ncbi:hypothetical protein [Limnobacter parvus]|uniref:Uncharacterized protein n=1 Tax=Limnobacter parvus TaxID=2939690 RepID=A0ABT1XK94_9BURK|nr:hypothetical protein [Limnobacter parvus]MCR2746687.1 hypothetical protein [Limnobacter parvus]
MMKRCYKSANQGSDIRQVERHHWVVGIREVRFAVFPPSRKPARLKFTRRVRLQADTEIRPSFLPNSVS